MKKVLMLVMSCVIGLSVFTGMVGCSGNTSKKGSDTITMVWYPNESGGDLAEARDELGKIVADATGKKVEHKLTTDYAIAIESLANDTAAIGFMGAQGYVEAHAKNDKVLPLAVPTGKSGTLDDAVYYSWLAVQKDNASKYKKGEEYSIDNIEGKKISFVSNSSTSGFKVPTSSIVSYFSKNDKWKDLTANDLMEGGKDKFFSEVLYGGSHQGAAVNILSEKSDIAAFCDTVLINYVDAVSGEFNAVGTTYKVKADAAEPFNTMTGKEFTAISSTPVLNSPIVMNTEVLSKEDQDKIITAFTSEEVTNNEKIFVPKGSEFKGLFPKEGKEQFSKVEDSWFEPVRKLSK
ncbi:MAG: PhnD/SsuA/transferrin family substrate-binding protein [Clostridium sp.]